MVSGPSNDVRAGFFSDGWVRVDGSSNNVMVIAAGNITVTTGDRGTGNTVLRRYR